MENNLLIAASALGTFLLFGCATDTLNKSKPSDNKEITIPKAESPLLVELLDTCPSGSAATSTEAALPLLVPLLGAAAAAIIPPLVNSGISATANWLDERALGRSASSTGSRTDHLWKNDPSRGVIPKQGCLIIVRGQFDESGAPLINPIKNLEGGTPWDEETTRVLNEAINSRSTAENKKNFTLLGYPEIYVQVPINYQYKEVTYKEGKNLSKITFPDSFSIELGSVHYLKSGTKSGSRKEKKLVIEINIEVVPIV